jgi:hypothetical protein
VQLERALRASGPLLILLLGAVLITLSVVSMWKENRQEEPLNGIISFALAVMGLCAFALLAGYV